MISVGLMRDSDRILIVASKRSENGAITSSRGRLREGRIDSILTKALDSVSFKVRRGRTVLLVLIAADCPRPFAFSGSTGEFVKLACTLVVGFDRAFEEAVDRRTPRRLQTR